MAPAKNPLDNPVLGDLYYVKLKDVVIGALFNSVGGCSVVAQVVAQTIKNGTETRSEVAKTA